MKMIIFIKMAKLPFFCFELLLHKKIDFTQTKLDYLGVCCEKVVDFFFKYLFGNGWSNVFVASY